MYDLPSIDRVGGTDQLNGVIITIVLSFRVHSTIHSPCSSEYEM
jgi:hypothetical protein